MPFLIVVIGQTLILVIFALFLLYELREVVIKKTYLHFGTLIGFQCFSLIKIFLQMFKYNDDPVFFNKGYVCDSTLFTCFGKNWTPDLPCNNELINGLDEVMKVEIFSKMRNFVLDFVLLWGVIKMTSILIYA